jgi:hypothetical protein
MHVEVPTTSQLPSALQAAESPVLEAQLGPQVPENESQLHCESPWQVEAVA